jgi:hypothetical protein
MLLSINTIDRIMLHELVGQNGVDSSFILSFPAVTFVLTFSAIAFILDSASTGRANC